MQRFRDGFTQPAPMAALGRLWDADPAAARQAARQVGYVLRRNCGPAASIILHPVLDLDYGPSRVIGDRAFHRHPGRRRTGGALVAGCGKRAWQPAANTFRPRIRRSRFPCRVPVTSAPGGHGRRSAPIAAWPSTGSWRRTSSTNCMDCNTSVFSNKWISYLRNDIKFDGVVFTDDLSMAGAGVVGGMVQRVKGRSRRRLRHALMCNAPEAVGEVLENWKPAVDPAVGRRWKSYLPRRANPGRPAGRSRLPGRPASH